MKAMKTILQYLLLAAIGVGIWYAWRIGWLVIPERRPMAGYEVLLFALALGFVWVDVLRWGTAKPFNCTRCMTGWFALILALVFHAHYWYLYLPAGVMVGAIYSAIQMRWL